MSTTNIVPAAILNSPMVDKDGKLTAEWQRSFFLLVRQAQKVVVESITPGGVIIAPLDVSNTINGRGGTLGSILAHLLDGGGFDSTDHITDGTGSPLAGGEEAYTALVLSGPSAGQVLQYNGTAWVPATLAAGGVTKVIAGANISVTPSGGTGDVTIAATGGSGLPVADPTFTGTITGPHYEGNGTAPGIAVHSGAGSGASVSLIGTDTAGIISLTVGSGSEDVDPLFEVTLTAAFSKPPRIVMFPADGATASIAANILAGALDDQHWVAYTNASIAAANYNWNYLVMA